MVKTWLISTHMWVLFWPSKINILGRFSFVFYCFVAFLAGYISACKLATLHSFCGSRSHIIHSWMCSGTSLLYKIVKLEQSIMGINPLYVSSADNSSNFQTFKKNSLPYFDSTNEYKQTCYWSNDSWNIPWIVGKYFEIQIFVFIKCQQYVKNWMPVAGLRCCSFFTYRNICCYTMTELNWRNTSITTSVWKMNDCIHLIKHN